MKLGKILSEKKQKTIFSVPSDASLRDAAKKLCEHSVGALMVTDPADPSEFVGIVSERDIIRRCCSEDRCNSADNVGAIMTKDIIVATSEDNVDYVISVMARHKIRHLPVIHEHKIAGIISMGDIVSSIRKEDEIRIRHLSDFSGGTYGSSIF